VLQFLTSETTTNICMVLAVIEKYSSCPERTFPAAGLLQWAFPLLPQLHLAAPACQQHPARVQLLLCLLLPLLLIVLLPLLLIVHVAGWQPLTAGALLLHPCLLQLCAEHALL
jgi:hypothetical protein